LLADGRARVSEFDAFAEVFSPEAASEGNVQRLYDLARQTTHGYESYARQLAQTGPLSELVQCEHRPGPQVQSDDEILDFCKQYGATIFHPSGTCKMGPDSDPMAVTNPQLQVCGVAGLRVVDCSVMPTLVSGNTNWPVVMMAEKAVDMILADAEDAP
jgi:choline dehydrogenase